MRVVEPKQFHPVTKQKPHKKRKLILFSSCLLLLAIATLLYIRQKDTQVASVSQNPVAVLDKTTTPDEIPADEPVDTVKDTLRIFTDNEFKVFYDNLLLPNLTRVENPPTISGNDIADARIRKIAEDRGYRLRSSPTVDLVTVEGNQVQSLVVTSWQALKSAATKAGYKISIVSGYRSEATQRSLFLSRLAEAGASIEEVAAGTADALVNQVLVTSSIPGYSKHHTGYTLDLLCAGYAFENFKNSPCNDWLSADNYKVAKENGFIPSYPPLADAQGPDPEAWEYVWVGTELLYE